MSKSYSITSTYDVLFSFLLVQPLQRLLSFVVVVQLSFVTVSAAAEQSAAVSPLPELIRLTRRSKSSERVLLSLAIYFLVATFHAPTNSAVEATSR